MFPFSTPLDYSNSQSFPFSLYPSSSHSTTDAYLPPSYASYDEQRSRIEQALLTRKQQERRQAEAAAFLAEQRQRERHAAIEEAIREERERREYERALRYSEEMVRRAREEEQAEQRYMQAMRVQEELARRQRLEEQQAERRRRNEQAEQQQSSLDLPDLFQLLFGSKPPQRTEATQPVEPASAPRPSTPFLTPRAESSRQGESSKLDLPHFLEAIFGSPRPSTTTQASTQQAPIPVSQPSPSPVAQTSSSPSPAPAPSAEPATPTPDVENIPPTGSPCSDEEEEAATKLQRHFRRHLARRNALDKISSLSSSFIDRQSNFEKPPSFIFKSSPDATSSTTTPPPLAFVSSNSPFLAYEDYLVNILSKIDAIESGGDKIVKQERKSLVRKIEKELSRLDAMEERAWEEQVKPAQSDSMQEDEKDVAKEQAGNEQDPPAASTTPAPSSDSLNYDDDGSLPPLLPLTHDAVSALPTSTPLSHSRSPSDSGSSTTSSTLTVSSASSQVDQYISEMLRRAQKLGEDVEKMEIDEKTKPVEVLLTV